MRFHRDRYTCHFVAVADFAPRRNAKEGHGNGNALPAGLHFRHGGCRHSVDAGVNDSYFVNKPATVGVERFKAGSDRVYTDHYTLREREA